MEVAYDALSPAMQGLLGELRVQYPPQEGLFAYVAEHLGEDIATKTREITGAGGVHPIVRTNPTNGRRAVYYAEGFAGPIEGLHADEAAALRAFLVQLPANPNRQCRWRWQPGDVVIWDERSTQHFGAADHRGQARTIKRVMVQGEVPA
jgi:taurine dioxygenase